MSNRNQPVQRAVELDEFEKTLVNDLQGGFPLRPRPFDELAKKYCCTAQQIQSIISKLLDQGVLSRFGPLYNIEKVGGAFSLCALKIPAERFDEVTAIVNRHEQVAHNYHRDHEWNMWFVLATASKQELDDTFDHIVNETGCPGINLPKEQEFFVGLRLDA
jgi:DNA-binding Lrp family transcriptional regulator